MAGTGKGPGPLGPQELQSQADPKEIFVRAVQHAFNNWTLLKLAVEQGWGGKRSAQKMQKMLEETHELLESKYKRRVGPLSDEREEDVDLLADFLFERILQLFNCEAEDTSPEEVARLVLKLSRTLQAGDFSFANEVLKHRGVEDLGKSCRGVEQIEYASPEDALAAGMESMAVDAEGAEGGEDSGSSDDDEDMQETEEVIVKKREPKPEPIVDEDGFTTVPTKRRGKVGDRGVAEGLA